jgi:transposase
LFPALQARHYGVGWLCAVIIWAEVGDALGSDI